MKRFLAVLIAFAVATVPVAARALEPAPAVPLAYDDGPTYPLSVLLSTTSAPVVQFEAPTAEYYALDEVSFYLLQVPVVTDPPTVPGEETFPVTVQLWRQAPAPPAQWIPGESLDTECLVNDEGWCIPDLTDWKVAFTGAIRVGVFLREEMSAPTTPLHLGMDQTPAGFSYDYAYDSTTVPPTISWTGPNTTGDYAIRVSIRPVPAMTCQGFLPPLDRTITMKWGGRNIPLKAFLADDAGLPLTSESLATPPVVALYLVDSAGAILEDKTSDVAAPGRSNIGQSFRNTYGGKWRYNLKTKKSLQTGTYLVQFVSGDVGEYVIDPACTGTFVITQGPKTKKAPKGKNK